MRTVRTKVYSFNELNENAKEVAVKNFNDINVDYEWSETTVNEMVTELNEQGFEDAKIYFSSFY